MLRHLRDYFPNWLMTVFLGLIALLIVGASLYNPSRHRSAMARQVVATVNKTKIKRIDLEFAYEKVKELHNLDQQQFTFEEKEVLRLQILEQLVIKEMLQQCFYNKGYRTHPKDVLNYIKNNPVLKQTFLEQQRLSPGYSKADFLQQVSQYRLNTQCADSLMQTAFILPEEAQRTVCLINQSRDFSYVELKPEQFSTSVESLPLDEVQAYYNQRLSEFRVPEKLSIDYIMLNRSDVLAELKANNGDTDEALLTHWQEKIKRLVVLTKTHLHSLSEAALELNLTIHTTDLFEQSGGSKPITQHPKVLTAAFSQAVREGNNSALISLDSERIMVLRVKHYEPLRLAPFEEVEKKVREQLGVAKAKESVKKCGENCVAVLKKNSSARLDLPKSTQWRKVEKVGLKSKYISSAILKTAFITSPKEKVSSVCLPNGDCIVIQLSKIRYGKLSQLTAKEREMVQNTMTVEKGQLEYQCYVDANKRDANIIYSVI